MNPTKILIKRSDVEKCRKEVAEHAKNGDETGFSFLGEIKPNKVYSITETVPAGPKSERSHLSFSFDDEYIRGKLEIAVGENDRTRYLGAGHSHPWPTTPEPSCTDMEQLKNSRKIRSWFFIAVVSSEGEMRFFGLDDDGRKKEIPFQIVPDEFSEEDLLARIEMITNNEMLRKSRVGIFGCGSLASAVAASLAGTGIGDYMVCDMESLSTVNLIRHLGRISELGRPKTKIIKDYIESHNPLAVVQTVNDDLIKNGELLRALIESCDIVVAASGNPELNYQINIICHELGKKAVYGGIFAGAKSAYVFCVPSSLHACFDCIFSLTSAAVDQNTLRRRYGLEEGELKEAQGMFADISVAGAMMAKMTLWLLLGNDFSFNLVRYYDDLKVERFNVLKRKLCATCDYERWMESEERKLNDFSVFEKFWRVFRFVRRA